MEEKTLYQTLKEKGVKTGNWQSDLYFPKTEETTKILKQFPLQFKNSTTFINKIDHKTWYDVPFNYDPYWEEKEMTYEQKQIKPIIESVIDSEYKATIKIRHKGTETKCLNVSVKQLKKIMEIMK